MANNASSFLPQLAGRLQRMVKFRITTHLDDFRRVIPPALTVEASQIPMNF